MTEQELRDKLKLKSTDLINTSNGLLDIFTVENDIVTYGFLSSLSIYEESVEDFLSHFKGVK